MDSAPTMPMDRAMELRMHSTTGVVMTVIIRSDSAKLPEYITPR